MNIDTDMQWAFLSGVRDYINGKQDYLAAQIGNPKATTSQQEALRPRVWLRKGEDAFVARLTQALRI